LRDKHLRRRFIEFLDIKGFRATYPNLLEVKLKRGWLEARDGHVTTSVYTAYPVGLAEFMGWLGLDELRWEEK
jgi:hypothetical protein